MRQKVLFFDIDGTLIGFDGNMPESTKTALRMAKERGHKLVICSGRAYCQIYPWLIEMGFDGIIGSAGAYVAYKKTIVNQEFVKARPLSELLHYLKEIGAVYLLQTAAYTVTDRRSKDRMYEIFSVEMGVTGERLDRLFGFMQVQEEPWLCSNIEKLVYYDSRDDLKTLGGRIRKDFDLTPYSFEKPLEDRGEITIRGINKAYGMQKLIDYLHVDRADTVAFGDGPNDFDMIQFAGTSVVMGNGVQELKKHAQIVTDDVKEDGIYNAMKKLELL